MSKSICFNSVISVENLERAWTVVCAKNSACGVDEVDVEKYSSGIRKRLEHLSKSLAEGVWVPTPYLRLDIPKNNGEKRTISLAAVEDKIVQTALKTAIEPTLERTFSSNSYAYRPGRGHVRCIRRTLGEMKNGGNTFFVRADIDDFFDSIDRAVLMKRLATPVPDEKVRHLIELCITMCGVGADLSWRESPFGIPQGATLSPLLANFYLTPFDQSVASRHQSYVRYSDDFIVWCGSRNEAESFSAELSGFLSSRLGLKLNENLEIKDVREGVEFLGLFITPDGASLTEKKTRELAETISSIEISGKELSRRYSKNLEGVHRYYLDVLPASYRETFSRILDESVCKWRSDGVCPNKNVLDKIYHLLLGKNNTANTASSQVSEKKNEGPGIKVKDAVRKRKAEYKRLEAENSEIVISSPGYYLGAGESGLILRKKGQPIKIRSAAVKHITVSSPGVVFSSNLVDYCSCHGIGLTFMGKHNALSSSLLSPKYLGASLWNAQSGMTIGHKHELARRLILSKLGNQENLCKYFNKYEKRRDDDKVFSQCLAGMDNIKQKVKKLDVTDTSVANEYGFNDALMAYEASCAELYWEYVRMLLADSGVEFYSRVKRGAKDLVNSMLNYGYSLLYPRIWQALLKYQLNPQIGFVHYAEGNSNLVFDFIELFRSQAVDKPVISMLRRRESCHVNQDGLLDDDTRKRLTGHIMERLNRHETYRGESRTLVEIINLQASELAESIAAGKTYRAYLAKW